MGPDGVPYKPIPESILTPDRIDTRLGKLEFFDGRPSEETVRKACDDLDFQRGVLAFLDTIQIASLHAMREGLREIGASNGTVAIWENLLDLKSLLLAANTESIYAMTWMDLKDGPVVIESPPNTFGFVEDRSECLMVICP